jgi:hypothetical protein
MRGLYFGGAVGDGDSPEAAAAEAGHDEARDREFERLEELFMTTPNTAAGVAAWMGREGPSGRGNAFETLAKAETGPAPREVFLATARSFRWLAIADGRRFVREMPERPPAPSVRRRAERQQT